MALSTWPMCDRLKVRQGMFGPGGGLVQAAAGRPAVPVI